MHCPIARAPHSPLQARLVELSEALDGYPAEALIEAWLAVPDSHSAASRSAHRIVHRTLSRWVAILGRDIEAIPAKSADAVETVRRRMMATRDALISVDTLAGELDGAASEPG